MADWFAPKRRGIGSGPPIAWQGWALLIGYIGMISLASFLIRYSLSLYSALLVTLTGLFLLITARTTKGGWRWRWGKDD